MSESTGKRKVFTAAAKRWLESQLEKARANGGELYTIHVTSTGRLAPEDIADFFRRNKFEANISKDSDAVYVVKKSAA